MKELNQIERILNSIKSKNELKLMTNKKTMETMRGILDLVQDNYHKCTNSWIQQLRAKGYTKLNIKGVEYNISVDEHAFKICNDVFGGVCLPESKEIILPLNFTYHNLLHELIHAYLDECNMNDYSSDELLVNCIAYLVETFISWGIGYDFRKTSNHRDNT